MATSIVVFDSQYHPVRHHYSPFTDEKTVLVIITCPRSTARQGYTGVSAQPLFSSAMADGDLGPILERVRGSSLSSFCPLEPQPGGEAPKAAGPPTSAPRSLGDEGCKTSLCSLTLGPFLEGLSPLFPHPQPPFCPNSLASSLPSQLLPHDTAACTPLAGLGAFALIWPDGSRPGLHPPAQPPQASLSHFVFLRFGSGALTGVASNALSG